MKKILILLVAFLATTNMNAQLINVMKDGKVIATFEGSQVDEVVYEGKSNVISGTAKRMGGSVVKWVQLWEKGPKFAEYNVGAENNKPEDLGGYYGWGSIVNQGNQDRYTGTDTKLSGDNDTATKLWGPNWRMPTKDELQALLDNCDVTWYDGYRTKYNNTETQGYLFTGKGAYSGNSIFLSAGGQYWNIYYNRWMGSYFRCGYWSSDLSSPGWAYCFVDGKMDDYATVYYGFQVRAVYLW